MRLACSDCNSFGTKRSAVDRRRHAADTCVAETPRRHAHLRATGERRWALRGVRADRAADRGRRDGRPADAERGDDDQRPLVGVDELGRSTCRRVRPPDPGNRAVASRPAVRATALLTAAPTPMSRSSVAASTDAVRRRHHQREADSEHDRGRKDVGDVVGAGVDRRQQRETEPEHDGTAGDEPSWAERAVTRRPTSGDPRIITTLAGTSAAPATDGLNPTIVWNATAVKKKPPLSAKYTSAVAALAPENCREREQAHRHHRVGTPSLDRHEHGHRDQTRGRRTR